MKIFKVGDRIQAICSQCGGLETAEFTLRDVPFSDNAGVAKNILVGACLRCDEVIVLPQQSAPAVNRQLPKTRKPIESRVPAHMIDILNVASEQMGAGAEFSTAMLKFYLHTLSQELPKLTQLPSLLSSELASGKAQKRISLKATSGAGYCHHQTAQRFAPHQRCDQSGVNH